MGPMRSVDAMPRSIGIRPSTHLSVHLWPAVAALAGAACLSYNGDRQRKMNGVGRMDDNPEDADGRAGAFGALRHLLGDRFTTALAVREQHGHDESYHATHAPDAVAFARTTEEVSQIVSACAGIARRS